jgi:hypothetical protein
VVAVSDVQKTAGGMFFHDKNTGLSSVKIRSVTTNMDGLSRRDRVRYDTPDLGGFMFSTSAMSDAYDAALRYSRKFSGFQVKGAVAWADPNDLIAGVDNQYSGSLAFLLNCGFNIAVSGGVQDQIEDDRDDATFWYTKLGYKADFFETGNTAFSVDYGEYYDIAMDDDTSKTFSLGAVQALRDWGTEFYLIYRYHELDRDLTDFDNINVVMTGARVKF